MGVAHHTPNPLGLERAAHMLFHRIENRLEASLEVGLDLFNVRTVAYKILGHCCPPPLCSTAFLFGSSAAPESRVIAATGKPSKCAARERLCHWSRAERAGMNAIQTH